MCECKFEVGKTYRTRDGRDVELVYKFAPYSGASKYDVLLWVDAENSDYWGTSVSGHFWEEPEYTNDVMPPDWEADE